MFFKLRKFLVSYLMEKNLTGKPFVIGRSILNSTILAFNLDVDLIGLDGSHKILPENTRCINAHTTLQ